MGEAAGVFEGEEEDAALEGDGVAQTSRRSGGDDRFSTFNIVVIALLALTAAVLTWRSFVLEGTASDLDHQAATQALAASSVAALADQEVTSEQSEYQRYLASLQTVHSLAQTTLSGPPNVVVEKAL